MRVENPITSVDSCVTVGAGESMKLRRSAYDDPVVDEIRAIRAKLWREAGGTVEGYLRLMDERTALRKNAEANKGNDPQTVRAKRANRKANSAGKRPKP